MIETKIIDKTQYSRGCTFRIQYHIVWCVKYRRQVISGPIEQFFKETLKDVAGQMGLCVSAMECMPDHIHLLIDCSPYHYIPDIVKQLKGVSSRLLFSTHPEIKRKLWNGHLWNPSYFVATVSENTEQQIRDYINSQKTK